MKINLLLVLFVISFSALAAPGTLVGVYPMGSVPGNTLFRTKLCPAAANIKKDYSFKAYGLNFETTDAKGREVESRGLLIVPDLNEPMPMFVYQHGTIISSEDLPSEFPIARKNETTAMAYCYAGLGYISVMADYLGYGDGNGMHPYIHADTEAKVGRDMMRAAKQALAQLNVQTTSKLFIAGYSQGGHAAMALLRLLDQDPAGEFMVTAAAPMAGPYDLAGTITEIDKNPSAHSTTELAFLLVGLNPIYSFYNDVSDLVRPEYAPFVESLFRGGYDWPEVMKALPAKPRDLIRADKVNELLDPNSVFMKALGENEVYKWTPKTTVRFYHGGGDLEVPFQNSQTAYDYMKAKGANVSLVNLGPTIDHSTGAPLAFGEAAVWFESLR